MELVRGIERASLLERAPNLTDWRLCQGMHLIVLCSVASCVAAAEMHHSTPLSSAILLHASIPAQFMPQSKLSKRFMSIANSDHTADHG